MSLFPLSLPNNIRSKYKPGPLSFQVRVSEKGEREDSVFSERLGCLVWLYTFVAGAPPSRHSSSPPRSSASILLPPKCTN